MNQQNKTERWEEQWGELSVDGKWCGCYEGDLGDNFPKMQKKAKDFISKLLSDARREERLRCLEALPKKEKIDSEWDDFDTPPRDIAHKRSYNQALTTAEESIKKLK